MDRDAAMGVTRTVNRSGEMMRRLAQLTKQDVLVGIPDTTADRQPSPDEKQPASNALIAYVLDRGSPLKNIPARPFLSPGIEDAKDAIAEQMKRGAVAAISGNADGVTAAQNAAGLVAQASVKKKMTSNIQPALAPDTIEARRRRGFTSDRTLVETGALLNAITYVIRRRG